MGDGAVIEGQCAVGQNACAIPKGCVVTYSAVVQSKRARVVDSCPWPGAVFAHLTCLQGQGAGVVNPRAKFSPA